MMPRGRKVIGERKEKRINVTMTNGMFTDLCILARIKGMSVGEVIRVCIAEMIARERDIIEQSREGYKGQIEGVLR